MSTVEYRLLLLTLFPVPLPFAIGFTAAVALLSTTNAFGLVPTLQLCFGFFFTPSFLPGGLLPLASLGSDDVLAFGAGLGLGTAIMSRRSFCHMITKEVIMSYA